MNIIARGAEAVIYQEGDKIIKVRKRKHYRLPELDSALRKSRTKREAKIFDKLHEAGAAIPKIFSHSDKTMKITMERIRGKQLRDVINTGNCAKLCESIGKQISIMHENNIIHGDLTTSNMLKDSKKVYLIDFGLSFFSRRIEDKAVDLHVLKESLKARHQAIWEKCFVGILKGYKNSSDYKDTLQRLEIVESRGRYKGKKTSRTTRQS